MTPWACQPRRPAADRISRRDFLRSSATAGLGVALAGPAFGQVRRARAAPAAAQGRRRAPGGRHRLRRPGPGAHRVDAAHPVGPHRGHLRHLVLQPPVHRQLPQEVRPHRQRLRGLPRAPGHRKGPPRGRRRHARLGPRRAGQRLSPGRAAGLLRKGDVQLARQGPVHGPHRPRDRQAPPDRPPAPLQSALHPRHRPAHPRAEASSAG